mgnify:CR=1 FL=1|jgi:uncharacterized membrane protein YhiD involved in acid resistance
MNNLQLPSINFSLFDLSLNLGIGFLLCFVVSLHYLHRSKTRIIRKDLAYALPAIGLTTLLVITVVKSSLALSLGLVGALSIVRFRTPIKEPEELAYIFLSIALGLCLGADQREAAMVGIPFILLIFSITSLLSNNNSKNSGKIHLTIQISNDKDHSISLKKVTSIVNEYTTSANFQRIDIQENNLLISCLLAINTIQETDVLVENLREVDPSAKISLLDDSTYPNE